MVGGHVGHDRDVVAVVAEAFAQDAAARHLEHGTVDDRVLQHHLRGLRAGHVALPDHPPVDDDAVRGGHANSAAHQLEDVGDHPDGRRLPVRAGDGHDRDARVRAAREQQVDHGLCHVLRLTLGRVGVHPEAGRGVHLDDRAALLANRHGDVRDDEVDAGDVQANHPGGRLRDLGVLGMSFERAVDRGPARRHVAGERELDAGSLCGDVVDGQALLGEELVRRIVEAESRKDLLVAEAAPGIAVLDVHQLANGVEAVCIDAGGHALGDRDHLSADHQDAVVIAVDVGLDDHVPAAAL